MPVSHPSPPADVPPAGLYSHIAVGRGDIIALTGQTGRNADGSFAPDIGAQAEQAFATIGQLLEAAGVDWSAVVSLRTYIVGRENMAGFRDARERIYSRIYPNGGYPANTLILVAGLGREEALIEVEALAVR